MPSKTSSAAAPTPAAVPAADAPAVLQHVLPRFLETLQAATDRHPDAPELVDTYLRQRDEDAERADGDAKELWSAVAKASRLVFAEHEGPLPLIDAVEEWEDRPEDGWMAVCTLCYLGASVDRRTIPSLAVAIHMTVAEFLYDATRDNPELYEGVILPWFVAYWTRVFGEARFRFHSTRLIERAIEAAVASEPDKRLQRLLGGVGFGLDVELPDEGKNWFEFHLD